MALELGGPVLGLLREPRFEQASVKLHPGDLLVMFSDGVVEAANAAGEEYGEDRLRAVVEQWNGTSAQLLHEHILRSVRDFTGGAAPHDDLTLVVAQFEPCMSNVRNEFAIEEMAAL